jgi:glycosyltransferase involved in cell wall biosynthesis
LDKTAKRLSIEPSPPLVSVVMPVYNGAAYIRAAVESVIRQTITNWELIILDDCSTDDTLRVLAAIVDPRIRVVESPQNRGQAHQMNTGIQLAKGQFIAIAHADDINEPERLEHQLRLFGNDPDIGVAGTWIRYTGDRDGVGEYPAGPVNCLAQMLDDSPFAHPTVMFKRSLLEKVDTHYRQEFVPAEDYELWSRLCAMTKFDNVPLPLVNYRVHNFQISHQRQTELRSKTQKIKALFLDANFPFLGAAQRTSLEALLALDSGSYIPRACVKTSAHLPRELARLSATDAAPWQACLARMMYRALTVTTRYQPGTGVLFFRYFPGYFFKDAGQTGRILWRSLVTRNAAPK